MHSSQCFATWFGTQFENKIPKESFAFWSGTRFSNECFAICSGTSLAVPRYSPDYI